MLLTQEIEIELNAYKEKLARALESKGYIIPREKNKWGNKVIVKGTCLKVKTMDLLDNTTYEIEFTCDYCSEEGIEIIEKTTYQRYIENRNRCVVKKDACKKCKNKKLKEANQMKYGIDNISQLDSIKKKKEETFIDHYGVKTSLMDDSTKEKIKQTCIEKYGVDNVAKNNDIKEKARQTNLERYGVDWTSQSDQMKIKKDITFMNKYGTTKITQVPEVKEKTKQTCIEKYGVEYVTQSEGFKEKAKNTLQEKYGVENISQIEEVKIKKAESFYRSGMVKTSRQQKYLHNLFGGELNYSDNTPSLDIAFPNEKMYIEYNGGGHDLCVKIGQMTNEDFNKREYARYYYLKGLGWKGIFINSPCDYLPSDEVLLKELEKAREWFDLSGKYHHHYNINIGDKINDANYNKLRKIKEEDLDKEVAI